MPPAAFHLIPAAAGGRLVYCNLPPSSPARHRNALDSLGFDLAFLWPVLSRSHVQENEYDIRTKSSEYDEQ